MNNALCFMDDVCYAPTSIHLMLRTRTDPVRPHFAQEDVDRTMADPRIKLVPSHYEVTVRGQLIILDGSNEVKRLETIRRASVQGSPDNNYDTNGVTAAKNELRQTCVDTLREIRGKAVVKFLDAMEEARKEVNSEHGFIDA